MSGRGVTNSPLSAEGEVRHHRHIRRPPKRRLRGRAPVVLVGVGAAILTCVAGYALGSLVLGPFASSPPQSGAYGIPNAPPGVSFVQAEMVLVNSTTVPAAKGCNASNLGTLAAPTALTSGATTALCLSHSTTGFALGDAVYTLEVAWGTAAANNTTFEVQVSMNVIPAANDSVWTSYIKTSKPISSSEQAVYAFDLIQSGDTGVTNFAVLVTEL